MSKGKKVEDVRQSDQDAENDDDIGRHDLPLLPATCALGNADVGNGVEDTSYGPPKRKKSWTFH